MKRQFVKNLSSSWLVYASAAVISFFLTPYIIYKLDVPAYGVWILVGSFSGYFGLFDFGIGYAVVRYVARYERTGEVEKRNAIISAAFYLALILAVGVFLVTIAVVLIAPSVFDIPSNLVLAARITIFLVGLSITLSFPLAIFSRALAGGLWRFDLFNLVSFIMGLIQAALTVLFLRFGWGLIGLGVAALLGSSTGYLWRLYLLKRQIPDLSVKLKLMTRPVVRQIGGYSFFTFLLILSGRIAYYSDSFIVGYFFGLKEVAVFGIAVKLTEYLRQLVFTLSNLFSPVAARYDPDTDKESLRRIFYDGSRLNLLFSLPISLVLFFWGGKLIEVWLGQRFTATFDYSAVILQVLLIGHVLSFTQGVGGEILLGVGKHRVYSILSMGAALVNIALSIVLAGKIGLIGVAWGTTIPLAALALLYMPLATLRLVDGRLADFFRKSLLPAILTSLFPAVIIVGAAKRMYGWPELIIYPALTAIVWVAAAGLFGLTPSEREKIIKVARRIF